MKILKISIFSLLLLFAAQMPKAKAASPVQQSLAQQSPAQASVQTESEKDKKDPQETYLEQQKKLASLLQLINFAYVQDVELDKLVEKAVVEMLKELDPHSAYISPKDVAKANEPLIGNFDGIGVSFQIYKDTISIIEVIQGGPAEKLGILSGDKIIRIDSILAVGDSATSDFVFRRLRGKKGTVVKVGIKRKGISEELEYDIVRDKIPIHSVEAYYMLDKTLGYIILSRFARSTAEEVRSAIEDLKSKGMKELILDLRSNSGGYLDIAVELSNEFLEKGKLVTYVEGKSQPRFNFNATSKGSFENGKMIVLIDEGSASASEILSGALQDWDRALIVGRRSYGKGLVQRPIDLVDNSQVRLTIARYYTPSGRCIQKPYEDGVEAYYSDISSRYKHGEMWNMDSVKFPDSVKYSSNAGRTVYGGGGIMPDVFVPIDTQRVSDYYVNIRRKNILNNFVMNELDSARAKWLEKYPSFEVFVKNFKTDEAFMQSFYSFAEKSGVKNRNFRQEKAQAYLSEMVSDSTKKAQIDSLSSYEDFMEVVLWSNDMQAQYLKEKAKAEDAQQKTASDSTDYHLRAQIKALLARTLYGHEAYYKVIREVDRELTRAIDLIKDDKLFKKLKIRY